MKDINKIWREFLIEDQSENYSCQCDQEEEYDSLWRGYLGEDMQDATSVFPEKTTPSRSGSPKFIVIHYTLTRSPRGTVSVLNKRGLSTHYEIDQNGEVYEYADPGSQYTWHGGLMNRHSIGVDITSRGSFSSSQVEEVRKLVTKLCNQFDIPQVVAKDGVKYTKLSQIQEDGVGIIRHRNLRSTRCPGKFPMERLGEPADTVPGEEGLDAEEKEDITTDLAKMFGFDKLGGFLDKIVDYVKDSTKINSQEDIAGLFKNIASKVGIAENKINENIKRFKNERNRHKRHASAERQQTKRMVS